MTLQMVFGLLLGPGAGPGGEGDRGGSQVALDTLGNMGYPENGTAISQDDCIVGS